jgi:hypothetical protein
MVLGMKVICVARELSPVLIWSTILKTALTLPTRIVKLTTLLCPAPRRRMLSVGILHSPTCLHGAVLN